MGLQKIRWKSASSSALRARSAFSRQAHPLALCACQTLASGPLALYASAAVAPGAGMPTSAPHAARTLSGSLPNISIGIRPSLFWSQNSMVPRSENEITMEKMDGWASVPCPIARRCARPARCPWLLLDGRPRFKKLFFKVAQSNMRLRQSNMDIYFDRKIETAAVHKESLTSAKKPESIGPPASGSYRFRPCCPSCVFSIACLTLVGLG